MLIWLQNNLSTLIVGVVLLAIVALVCLSMVRNKRKGKSSCGCGWQRLCAVGQMPWRRQSRRLI